MKTIYSADPMITNCVALNIDQAGITFRVGIMVVEEPRHRSKQYTVSLSLIGVLHHISCIRLHDIIVVFANIVMKWTAK